MEWTKRNEQTDPLEHDYIAYSPVNTVESSLSTIDPIHANIPIGRKVIVMIISLRSISSYGSSSESQLV